MLGTKELYDREDLMKEADNIALSCIKDYDLSDYAENVQRAAHWAVNVSCNCLWVKNGGLPFIIKGHNFYEDISFPFGGSNCSSTHLVKLESLNEVKDFLLADYKTDYNDPCLIDIAEGVCTIDTSLDNSSITNKVVILLHIPQNELTKDNVLLAPAKQMLQELKDADTDYEIDFNNPFYGTSRNMRFSDLTALYEAYIAYKDAMQNEPELD